MIENSELSKARFLRWSLAPWLLFAHGIPKLCAWWLGLATWGPHINYSPKSFSSGIAAVVEVICPALIIIGFKIRPAAFIMAFMLILSAFSLPLPWIHERIPLAGHPLPFAIIPSKEMTLAYAIAYLAIAFFAKDESIWARRNRLW